MRRFSASGAAWASLWVLVGGTFALAVAASVPRSPLTPVLPPGVVPSAWLARAAAALGLDRLGTGALAALSLLVVAAMVAAFVVLLLEAWRGRVSRGVVVAAGLVALALAVAAPLLLSRDVYSYAVYGDLAAHGSNPYVHTPAGFGSSAFSRVLSPEWRDTRSVYGPAFTLISEAISRGVGTASGVVLSYKLLAAAGVAAAALFSAAAAERHAPGRWAFGFAMVALNPVLLIHTVGGAHNDALVAAGLAAAAFVALSWPAEPMSGRAFAVTAILAVTSMVKIVAAIALALWVADLVRRDSRRWASVALAHLGVALGIGAALSLRYLGGGRVVTALANLAGRQGWASPARLVARGAEAVGDLISPAWGHALSTLVLVAFLVLFGLALVHIVRAESPSPPARWAMALVVFALAAPYLLPWYAAWFVALLTLVAALPDRRFLAVGIGTTLVLALTGIPAEPAGSPGLWHGMVLAVHYVAAPLLLFLLLVALRSVADRPLPTMAGRPAADDEVERSRSS